MKNNLEKKESLRKCVGCNEMKNKKSLIRVVHTKEDEFFVDLNGKANGRGTYLCKNVECFQKAIKSKGLERSLKCKIPEDTILKLEQELS